MSNIGFTCDVCGRTVQGITFVNGMKFCSKCYQETFGKVEVVDRWASENALYIEQLKQENEQLQRLLDAKEKIETNSIKGFEKLKKENKQLKEQLAKKDSQLRHDICEKIRDKVQKEYHKEPMICSSDGDVVLACVYLNTIDQLLNDIEGAKEKLNANKTRK